MKRRFLKVCIAVVSVLFLCVTNMKLNVFAEELTGMEDNSAGSGEALDIPDLYGIVDTEAPIVRGIELAKIEVEAPGTVEVIADFYDEVSGVSYASISFKNEETQKKVSCQLSKVHYDENHNLVEYEDGRWHGELRIDQYCPSGKYIIYYVYLVDNAGNSEHYYENKSGMGGMICLPEELWNIEFEVKNENIVDTEAPVVRGIELAKTEVEAPGTVEVTADLYDEVSGVSYASISFKDKETQKMVSCQLSKVHYDENHNLVEYEDERWHGELQIDQYCPSGKYIIYYVYLVDNAGNSEHYYENKSGMGGMICLPEKLWDLGFSVFNDDMGAVVLSGTTNPNLVDDIKNASEDAVIAIDYTQNSNLNKDVFDAIAGTDKKIALLSEGVQWEFNGKDIVNDIKEIDLKVDVSPLPQVNTQTGNEIEQITKEQPSVVLHFPENGVLPGKAKIRVKADYSLRKYLGEEGLCVYYYDNTNKVFVPIASDLKITSDYYIEFEIEHCSDYVVTKGAVSDLSGAAPDSGKEPGTGENPDSGKEPDTGEKPDSGKEPDTGAASDDEKQPDNGTVLDEEEDEQEEENTTNAVSAAVAPNTGDEALSGLYLFLMAVSAAGMMFALYRRKGADNNI